MALPYWTQEDLEDYCGSEYINRVLDDNNDAQADPGPLDRLQKSCDAYVEGYLRGIYSLDSCRSVKPEQVVRLSLQRACVLLARRPQGQEMARADWKDIDEATDRELKALRKGEIRLDIEGSPEPAANQGGEVWDGGDDLTEPNVPVFNKPCGFGIF